MFQGDFEMLVAPLNRQLERCASARDIDQFARHWSSFFELANDLNRVIVAWVQLRQAAPRDPSSKLGFAESTRTPRQTNQRPKPQLDLRHKRDLGRTARSIALEHLAPLPTEGREEPG